MCVVVLCWIDHVLPLYVGRVYVGLSKRGHCVFLEFCPVSFLVVGESPLILLQCVFMLYDNCGDDG